MAGIASKNHPKKTLNRQARLPALVFIENSSKLYAILTKSVIQRLTKIQGKNIERSD